MYTQEFNQSADLCTNMYVSMNRFNVLLFSFFFFFFLRVLKNSLLIQWLFHSLLYLFNSMSGLYGAVVNHSVSLSGTQRQRRFPQVCSRKNGTKARYRRDNGLCVACWLWKHFSEPSDIPNVISHKQKLTYFKLTAARQKLILSTVLMRNFYDGKDNFIIGIYSLDFRGFLTCDWLSGQ